MFLLAAPLFYGFIFTCLLPALIFLLPGYLAWHVYEPLGEIIMEIGFWFGYGGIIPFAETGDKNDVMIGSYIIGLFIILWAKSQNFSNSKSG